MRLRVVLVAAGLAVGTGARAETLPAWLAGCWQGEERSAGITETWTAPRGGLMLGLGHTVRGTRSRFEFLRIVERDGAAVYIAQPDGRPPVEFAARTNEPGRIVFANPAHDAPKTIEYRRDGDRLLALLDGRAADNPNFSFRRIGCDALHSPR